MESLSLCARRVESFHAPNEQLVVVYEEARPCVEVDIEVLRACLSEEANSEMKGPGVDTLRSLYRSMSLLCCRLWKQYSVVVACSNSQYIACRKSPSPCVTKGFPFGKGASTQELKLFTLAWFSLILSDSGRL